MLRQQLPEKNKIVQQLDSTVVSRTLMALALGEILADKVPQAPDRTFAPALVFRALTGGGASALLWSLHKRPAWLGGLLGASTAIAMTFASFKLRLWLGRMLPVPNALSWSELLEDAVVCLGGWFLLNNDEKLSQPNVSIPDVGTQS